MKSVKRVICLLLAVLLVAVFTACNKEVDTKPTATPEPTQSTSVEETPTPGPTEENKYAERVTITYACPQVRAGFDYTNGDDYAKMLSEKFNYEFKTTNLPWNEWHSLLSTWIMAQNMPDVIIYNYGEGTHADAVNFVQQGLIRRLPDDWKEKWPGVADVYAKTTLGPKLEEMFGGTYFIPRARFYYNLLGEPLANHWSAWVRWDWIQAVGKEKKNNYSIPELMEIARLIKEKDPDGLGDRLAPMSFTTNNAARFFLEANSTYWNTFYKGADGKYAWGAAHERTLEGLKLWYQAFTEGILDPEFYLLEYEQDMEKFQTLGEAGISYLGGQTADIERYRIDFSTRTGLPQEAFGMATLLGTDGYYHQRDLINYWGAIAFSPKADEKVVERWLDVMEWACSEDGYPSTSMGIKGVDWDRDANGNLVSLVPEGVLLSGDVGEGKYPSLGHVLGSVILWDDLQFDNPNITPSYRDESKALYQNRYDLSTPETFTKVDWKVWMNGTENMRRARGIAYDTEFANMVTTAKSEEDLVQIYEKWLQDQMAIIQPVLDELNQ